MTKSVLQCAASVVLATVSFAASAHPGVAKPIAINAVLQEKVGPMARCPSQFGGTITGAGDSELLGRVVFISTDCITQTGPIYNFSRGEMIIVTATGDQIFADYSGQFVPTGDGAKFVFSGATFQVTGGNGEYRRASGGGTLTGGEDMLTGAGTVQLTGKIMYKE